MMKFIFGMQINIDVFHKFKTFWVCVTSYAPSTQNDKFAYLSISPENYRG